MNITFRADASVEIGSGHVIRCLTLADCLKKFGHNIQFVTRMHTGNYSDYIEKRGYKVHRLTLGGKNRQTKKHRWLGVNWRLDAEDTAQIFKETGKIDWLIVDHYGIDFKWENAVRHLVSKIMVIDDLANRSHDCDLLLDQTINRRESEYKELVRKDTCLILGNKYALLKKDYKKLRQDAIKKRRQYKKIERVLICFGGHDPDNFTARALNGLEMVEWPHDIKIDIILGGNAPHIDAVKRNAQKSFLKIKVYSDVENMAEFILQADLAIGAGGTTSWERCCLGLPTLIVATASNQEKIVKSLSEIGAALEIKGDISTFHESVSVNVKQLLNNREQCMKISQKAFSVCDGKGTGKVAEKIIEYSKLDLRLAEKTDCLRIYDWQSQPGNRKYFRNPKVPTIEEHEKWFEKTLLSEFRELFIIEKAGMPIGFLRLDNLDEGKKTYEISILISKEYQGKGFASDALRMLRINLPTAIFRAEVLRDNLISKRLFESADFKKIDDSWFINNPEKNG